MADISETRKLIYKKVMSGKNRYSYCPVCYKTIGEDKSALAPLTFMRHSTFSKTEKGEFRSWVNVYFCERCHKTWERNELEDQYIGEREELTDAT